MHVADADVAAAGGLLGWAEEILHEDRRPGGEHELVRGEHLAAHLEVHVRALLGLEEAAEIRGQAGHGDGGAQRPHGRWRRRA